MSYYSTETAGYAGHHTIITSKRVLRVNGPIDKSAASLKASGEKVLSYHTDGNQSWNVTVLAGHRQRLQEREGRG